MSITRIFYIHTCFDFHDTLDYNVWYKNFLLFKLYKIMQEIYQEDLFFDIKLLSKSKVENKANYLITIPKQVDELKNSVIFAAEYICEYDNGKVTLIKNADISKYKCIEEMSDFSD